MSCVSADGGEESHGVSRAGWRCLRFPVAPNLLFWGWRLQGADVLMTMYTNEGQRGELLDGIGKFGKGSVSRSAGDNEDDVNRC